MKTGELPRERVRRHREAESGPGERWKKWVKLSLKMNLICYNTGTKFLTSLSREFCKRRKWCEYMLGVIQ